MRTAGIICEYNPFHQGHRYQIQEVRRRLGPDTGVVCLMGGNYVQRGEPAIYDKWTRSEIAVRQGADLVLELPLTVAVNAGGYFAAGAVDCLLELGCVDTLCFGTEGADAETLWDTARLLRSAEFDRRLREALSSGVSYARARELALKDLGGDAACLATPNNALGVDYLRRLLERERPMELLVIPRQAGMPTATALRRALLAGTERPLGTLHALEYGERAMLSVLRTLPDAAFEAMPFGSEGLWSRVRRACRRENSLEAICLSCKSKRYAYSRLRRMLLCLFLGLDRETMARKSPYLRVLAFNERGRTLLHGIKRNTVLVSGPAPDSPEAKRYFALEQRATDLYGLFAPPGIREPMGRERSHRPRYLPEA